jgi:hypothetical protein
LNEEIKKERKKKGRKKEVGGMRTSITLLSNYMMISFQRQKS